LYDLPHESIENVNRAFVLAPTRTPFR